MEKENEYKNEYYLYPIGFNSRKTKRFSIKIKQFLLKFLRCLKKIHTFNKNSNKMSLFDHNHKPIPQINSIDLFDRRYICPEIRLKGRYKGKENEKVSNSNHRSTINGDFDEAVIICEKGSKPFYAERKSRKKKERKKKDIGCRIEE